MQRTFGKLSLASNGHAGQWSLSCEPQVAMMLKRVFHGQAKHQFGTYQFENSPRVCRELEWFESRYPLAMSAADRASLAASSRDHQDHILRLEQIVDPSYNPREFQLAVPAREYQRRAAELYLANQQLLLADEVGLGKAQPDDSRVLTPTGWRRLDELAVGDAVVDPDGGAGLVTGIFPQGYRDVFRVVTKDGGVAESCEEHLWGVFSQNDRFRGGAMRVRELREFMSDLSRSFAGAPNWRINRWFLPVMQPAKLVPDGKRPLDPYLLGVLIGDGTLCKSVRFTSVDEEIIEGVRATVPPGVRVTYEARASYRIARTSMRVPRNPVFAGLDSLGLAGKRSKDKFIPRAYMTAPINARLALLQGLMDTDGECAADGTSLYSTSSPRLRDDVIELVRSLGGIASAFTKESPRYTHNEEKRVGLPSHRVNVRLPICPFRLSRKVRRWKPPIMARPIVSVERSRRALTRCIAVSTKRHLYVTDGHLVTHNTATAICSFLDTRTLPAVVVCLAHLPRQWKREIEKFAPELNCHIIKKGTPYELPKVLGCQPDVLVITYHKLRGWADVLAKYAKSIVWDEAQELRRTGSDRYAAAKHLSKIPFRLGASATPMYNYGGEMFNVLNIIAPGQLGSQVEFNREWCEGYENKLRLRDPDAFGAYLREQCLMLRRTRHDVNRELPPVSLITHEVDSDPEALKAVEGNAGELARLILSGAKQERGAAMRAAEEFSMLLRQATGISKSPYVASFVELLIESGEPVVLYGWHRAVYDVWKTKLAKYNPAFYTGTESAAQKELAVRRFVSGETPLMILSLRSGAGLDGLQHRCRTVVFGEFDWSWGVHIQNIGRVHRDGQPDPVAAYFLRSDSGADPFMCDALGLKRRQLEGVIVPGEGELLKELGAAQHNVAEMARRYLEG